MLTETRKYYVECFHGLKPCCFSNTVEATDAKDAKKQVMREAQANGLTPTRFEAQEVL